MFDDIEPLARHFLAHAAKKNRPLPDLSAQSVDWLEAHSWPGNVRELRNLMERALILCEGPCIEPEHLPLDPVRSGAPRVARAPQTGSEAGLRGELKTLERERIQAALSECNGNQRQAAERLGLSRGALLRRLELLQIARPRKGS